MRIQNWERVMLRVTKSVFGFSDDYFEIDLFAADLPQPLNISPC
jgi:hypothetical protein